MEKRGDWYPLFLWIGAIVTTIATHLITSRPVFYVKLAGIYGYGNFNRTVWRAGACCAVTFGAVIFIGILMPTHPDIADRVHRYIMMGTSESRFC